VTERLNKEENDFFRLEVIWDNGVLFMEEGFLIAAEISLAAAFLPASDLASVNECTWTVVANLTAERILALLTELLPAGLFIVRKGRGI